MVRELDGAIHRDGEGRKLYHARYTVVGLLGSERSNDDRTQCKGRDAGSKTPHRHGSNLRGETLSRSPSTTEALMADEFSLYVWGPDWKTPTSPDADPVFVTLTDRREISSATGTKYWEYRARTAEGKVSEWLPESGLGGSFTLHELDAFHALCNLYCPFAPRPSANQIAPAKPKTRLSRADALNLFPLGT